MKRVIFIAIIVAMLIPALVKAEPSSAYVGGRDGIGWNLDATLQTAAPTVPSPGCPC